MELPDDFRDLLVCLHDAGAELASIGGYRGLAAFGAPLSAFEVSNADFASYDGAAGSSQ